MDLILEASKILLESKNVAVLTGAGISVDSGIPDFRSAGGIWERFDPEEYAYFNNFKRDPKKIWNFFLTLEDEWGNVKPNSGHYALTELQEMGIVRSIATQNIDYLHQKAGSKKVIDLHGNNNFLVCIYCKEKYEKTKAPKVEDRIPYCRCGKILKPAVTMFGEMLPEGALESAQFEAMNCSVYIVAGTSAQVSPVNMLPYIAKQHGAKIIEVNLEDTGLTESITDIQLKGSTSKILPLIVEKVKKLKKN